MLIVTIIGINVQQPSEEQERTWKFVHTFYRPCILWSHSIGQNSITGLYKAEEEAKNYSLAVLTVYRRKINWVWWACSILCEDWNHVFLHLTWTLRTETISTVHVSMSLMFYYIYEHFFTGPGVYLANGLLFYYRHFLKDLLTLQWKALRDSGALRVFEKSSLCYFYQSCTTLKWWYLPISNNFLHEKIHLQPNFQFWINFDLTFPLLGYCYIFKKIMISPLLQ